MSSVHAISAILDRVSSTPDRDHRFIALKDFRAELSKLSTIPPSPLPSSSSSSSSSPSLPLDPTSETKLATALLTQVLTSSSELQELAISCLTLLTPLLHTASASSLLHGLLSYALDPTLPLPGHRASSYKGREYDDEDDADATVIDKRQAALSALLSTVPALRSDDSLRPLAERLLPFIMDALDRERTRASSGASDLTVDLLSLLLAFLSRHAASVDFLHADLLQFFLGFLSAPRLTVKATVGCLAALAPHLAAPLFASLVNAVIARYGKGDATSYLLIASLASSSPSALSVHALSLLAPLLKSASARLPGESVRAASEEREGCLMALETLMRGCGAEVVGEAGDVVKVLASSLAYDPNFVGAEDGDDADDVTHGDDDADDDDDMGAEDGDGPNAADDGDEYVEAMSDEEVVDEEDTSGMVRRAASKCVLALLAAMSSVLSTPSPCSSSLSGSRSKSSLLLRSTLCSLTEQLAPVLLSRFHERTDHILIDLLHAFEQLIDIARALRLSITVLLPQPQLNKAIAAVMAAKGKARGRLNAATMTLLTHSYHALMALLTALPPHTILAQLHELLGSLSAVIRRSEKDASPTATALLSASFALLTALIQQVSTGEWVSEVESVGRLLVSGVRSDRGKVVEAALSAVEELVEMLSAVGLMSLSGPSHALDATFLPMTLLDAACDVESEEERRNSWRLRGEDVLTTAKALTSSSLEPKQIAALQTATAALVPLLHTAITAALQASSDRAVRAAALNTFGLLYSHLPAMVASAAPAADVLKLLQGYLDSPLTRVEAARALARAARCVSFVNSGGAVQPALPAITAALVGYLKQTDRTLQHFAMAALNTLTLRALSISLHHNHPVEISTITALTVLPALTPLVNALIPALPPLHSLLALPGDWLAELESALTLLSHIAYLGLCCPDTRAAVSVTVSGDTLVRLIELVSTTLPSAALSYAVSLAVASVFALYAFAGSGPTSVDGIQSAALTAFTAAPSSPHRCRVLSMIAASSVLASTIGSVRGFSEMKAEIGWLPPAPTTATSTAHTNDVAPQRAKSEEDIGRHIVHRLHIVQGSAGRDEKAFALGVLGEIGRVHSLSPALYPALLTALLPVGDAELDVAGAPAFGLITIGNPVELYPRLTALLIPHAASSSLALHALYELLHHLAHHQVLALSHPFNPATVQPHSIPFPSTSLILLIQALSASVTDTILPILFSLSTSPSPDAAHLAVNSLTRLMALFPAPTLTAVGGLLQRPEEAPLVSAVLNALSSFVSVYLSAQSPPLPSQSIDAHHRHNFTRPKLLPPSSIFTAQLFSLLPSIIPLLTSPSLSLRSSAVGLLSSVAAHAPQLLTVHLGALLRELDGFAGREERFITRKEYGPIVREVDDAVEGRVEGWEMLRLVLDAVEMNARWYSAEDSGERAAACASVLSALRKGLSDDAEVRVSALSAVAGALRSLPLTVTQAVEVVALLRASVEAVAKADAVGAEVTQHEEMLRAAVSATREAAAVVESDRTLAALRTTDDWRALDAAVRKRTQVVS